MRKLIDFMGSLATDANVQARLLLGLMHLPLVVLLLVILRQEKYMRRKHAFKKNLLFILDDFARFCKARCQAAIQGLGSTGLDKADTIEAGLGGIAAPAYPVRLWMLLFQNPEVFLVPKLAVKAAARWAALRDRICLEQESLAEEIRQFLPAYRANETLYFQQISQLARLHDSLEEHTGGKPPGRNGGTEWLNDYFKIFGDWFRKGAARDIETSYREIVVRILLLNKMHRDVPLVFQTNESALKCENAYNSMVKLKTGLQQKLTAFAWQHRLAGKLTRLMITRLNPAAAAAALNHTPVYIARKKRMGLTEQYIGSVCSMDLAANRYRVIKRILYMGIGLLLVLGIVLVFHPLPPAKQAAPHANTTVKTAVAPVPVPASPPDSVHINMAPHVFIRPVPVVYGIDISKYQGSLLRDIDNMDTLHFVICKATEGDTYVDPDFDTNWKFIRKKGLVRGAYHFYHSQDDPVKQAQHFLATIKNLDSTDIPPVIDIEEGGIAGTTDVVALENNLLILLNYIEQKIKRKPVIYTDLNCADKYLINESFAEYPLWLAEYSGKERPRLPATWKKKGYAIWQKRDSYKIDSRNTDFDVFNGTGNELIEFIRRH